MKRRGRYFKNVRQQTADLLEIFWRRFFQGELQGVDAVLYCGIVHMCASNGGGMLDLDGCKTSYAELGRLCNMDWRCVKSGLVQISTYGLIKMQATGRGIFIRINENGKEEKKQRKGSSPESPLPIEKKEKKEKSVREEKTIAPAFFEKSFDERKKDFQESIKPFVATYGTEVCNEFFQYWVEPTTDGLRMRFELERTWSVAGRLSKWKRLDLRIKGGMKGEEKAAVSTESAAEREKKRVENEKRRDLESLNSCPQWAWQLAKSRGFESADDTEAIYKGIQKLSLARELTSDEQKNWQQWSARREKELKIYEKKWGIIKKK